MGREGDLVLKFLHSKISVWEAACCLYYQVTSKEQGLQAVQLRLCGGFEKKKKKTCTRARVQCMGTFHLKIERALCSPVLKVRLYYINENSICFSGRGSEINFCANFRTKEWYGLFPGIILDDEVISQKFYFEINSFAFSQRQLYEKGFWENMLETCFVIRSHNTLLKKNV